MVSRYWKILGKTKANPPSLSLHNACSISGGVIHEDSEVTKDTGKTGECGERLVFKSLRKSVLTTPQEVFGKCVTIVLVAFMLDGVLGSQGSGVRDGGAPQT